MMIKVYILTVLLMSLVACTSAPLEKDVYPNDPDFSPVAAQSLQPPPTANGSLFQERYSFGLYTDQQATRVGDIITVIFDEQYRSKKSAGSKANKSSSQNTKVNGIFGSVPGVAGATFGVDASNKQNFNGKGEANRTNSLSGKISVTVSEILPNGVLRIRGEKWLTLSEGDEYIRIRGLVRPQDVSPANTVSSTNVADARISFGGKGALNNTNKQGWFGRMMMSPWWPF